MKIEHLIYLKKEQIEVSLSLINSKEFVNTLGDFIFVLYNYS